MNKGDALLIELDYTVNGEALKEGEWDDIEFALNSKSYSLSNGDIYWDGEAYVCYLSEADTFDLRFTNIYQLRLAKDGYVISSPITQWRVGGVLSKKYITGEITTSRYDALIERTITSINSNASKVGEFAFDGCNALTTAIFPEATEVEGWAFNGCEALKKVVLSKATSIGAEAFASSGLEKIDAPLVESIGDSFKNCSYLTDVNMPKLKTIGTLAFNSSGIVEASFPECESIGQTSFANCPNLEVLDLGNVANIPTNAFASSTKFDTLILRKSDSICTIGINSTAFNNTPFGNSTWSGGKIYVPQALIEAYETNLGRWAYVKGLNANNKFEAIEGSIYE